MKRNIGMLDTSKFVAAHENTMFVQTIFPDLDHEEIRANTFAYPPCWGILDPGMTMEKHQHPIPEFYVFVQGVGEMVLGTERFNIASGMSVNIPRNMDHEVTNPESATEPLIWVSIGLKE
jgi:mannose-6-phosphate isomerase-like protein (cupin superfamily)